MVEIIEGSIEGSIQLLFNEISVINSNAMMKKELLTLLGSGS